MSKHNKQIMHVKLDLYGHIKEYSNDDFCTLEGVTEAFQDILMLMTFSPDLEVVIKYRGEDNE